jgi:hypothetical protein
MVLGLHSVSPVSMCRCSSVLIREDSDGVHSTRACRSSEPLRCRRTVRFERRRRWAGKSSWECLSQVCTVLRQDEHRLTIASYNHYVELVEPGGNRACIKCCDDPADCPLDRGTTVSFIVSCPALTVRIDTQGCQSVIPGNYFDCS